MSFPALRLGCESGLCTNLTRTLACALHGMVATTIIPWFCAIAQTSAASATRDAWPLVAVWQVDAKPIWQSLTTGPTAAASAGLANAFRMPSGEVVGFSRIDTQVVVFDGTGRLVRRIGRSGQGPGEFFRGGQLIGDGDGFRVLDGVGRVSVFDRTGRFVRTFQLRDGFSSRYSRIAGRVLAGGIFKVSRAYTADEGSALMALRESQSSGRAVIRRDSMVVATYDSLGNLLRMTAPVLGHTYVLRGELSTIPGGGGTLQLLKPFPLMRDRTLAIGVSTFFVYRDAESEIAVYSDDGRLITTTAVPVASLNRRHQPGRTYPITAEDKRAGFLTDELGNLWFEGEETGGHSRWHVISPRGVIIAEARIPAGTRVLHIGSDYVVISEIRDDVDVVKVHSLRK